MAPKSTAPPRRAPRARRRDGGKPKVCALCAERSAWIDYKDAPALQRFISDRGKIRARAASGNCARHQGEVAAAIKTARELALLPYPGGSAAREFNLKKEA